MFRFMAVDCVAADITGSAVYWNIDKRSPIMSFEKLSINGQD